MPILIALWIRRPSSLHEELTMGYSFSPATIARIEGAGKRDLGDFLASAEDAKLGFPAQDFPAANQ